MSARSARKPHQRRLWISRRACEAICLTALVIFGFPQRAFGDLNSAIPNATEWYGRLIISVAGNGDQANAGEESERHYKILHEVQVDFHLQMDPQLVSGLQAIKGLPPEFAALTSGALKLRSFIVTPGQPGQSAILSVEDEWQEKARVVRESSNRPYKENRLKTTGRRTIETQITVNFSMNLTTKTYDL